MRSPFAIVILPRAREEDDEKEEEEVEKERVRCSSSSSWLVVLPLVLTSEIKCNCTTRRISDALVISRYKGITHPFPWCADTLFHFFLGVFLFCRDHVHEGERPR